MKKNEVLASVIITNEGGHIKEQHDFKLEISAQSKFDELERVLRSKKYGLIEDVNEPNVGELKLEVTNKYGKFLRRSLAILP